MMMKKTIVTALLLPIALWAHADEMYMQEAFVSVKPATSWQENNADGVYRIPFKKSGSDLGPAGNNALSEILPRLRNAQKIVVQGRPDHPSSSKTSEKSLHIPEKRALALKRALVNNGISESKISLEQLGEPSYSDKPNVYNATIKVFDYAQNDDQFHTDSNAVVSLNSASKLNAAGKQQAIPVGSVRKVLKTAVDNNLSAMDTGRLFESWIVVESPMLANKKPMNPNEALIAVATVRRVLKVAIDGNLSAVDASRMFESWMAVELAPATAARAPNGMLASGNYTPRNQYGNYGNAATGIPTFTALPRQTWQLDPAKTLRDNISDWSRLSGWADPQWKASNSYQVTSAMSFEGDLTDALRQVSEQARLNICITHAQKSIKITDSNVSCKE
jgi:hypothetical protein